MRTKDVAIRPMLAEETTHILRAMLKASDYGVLFTDLNHNSIACNRKFGELFSLDIMKTVSSEPEDVRRQLYPRLESPAKWIEQLDVVYADPLGEFSDELTLLGEPAVYLRRFTGPVLNEADKVVGRIWTFLDISGEKRQQRMQQALFEVSTFNDPEPAKVCRFAVEKLASFYGDAIAALSLWRDKYVDFRIVINQPLGSESITEIPIGDAH
ncbi:MAG: hypothetical protein ACR2HJ_11505 [Fimbriimonadales bacterium]